jgi:hypothetical protein
MYNLRISLNSRSSEVLGLQAWTTMHSTENMFLNTVNVYPSVMILHLRVPEINLAEIYVEQKPESTCFNFSFILLTLF